MDMTSARYLRQPQIAQRVVRGTRYVSALIATQVDSPAPGPGDVVGVVWAIGTTVAAIWGIGKALLSDEDQPVKADSDAERVEATDRAEGIDRSFREGVSGSAGASLGSMASRLLANPALHDHHLLPVQFKDFFAARGINIDDHTITVSRGVHLRGIHGKAWGYSPGLWNKKWEEWIKANPNATQKDIYQQLGRMMDEFGLTGYPIHPYGQ
jgi:hypothetical protein